MQALTACLPPCPPSSSSVALHRGPGHSAGGSSTQHQPPTQAAGCSCRGFPGLHLAGHHREAGKRVSSGTRVGLEEGGQPPLRVSRGQLRALVCSSTRHPEPGPLCVPERPHLSVNDHHAHKHAEEDERGEQDEDDGERPARGEMPFIQLLLQVCPAINLLRQGGVCQGPPSHLP